MAKRRKSSSGSDFRVIRIPGDGRCMFRSLVHGACLRAGTPLPTEKVTKELADDLRNKVVNRLIKRQAETKRFLEGDFKTYVSHMKQSHAWGGEPELLMSSHVLKVPITVYTRDKKSKSIEVVAEYGQEYGKENPVTVLYHAYGHYDLLNTQMLWRKWRERMYCRWSLEDGKCIKIVSFADLKGCRGAWCPTG